MKNTKIILAKRPIGLPKLNDFQILENDIDVVRENQVSVNTM